MTAVSVQIHEFTAKEEKKAHSPFSASGAERWFACPGSVELSKPLPDKDSPWSIEGTRAHGVLERIMVSAIAQEATAVEKVFAPKTFPKEMILHGQMAANVILKIHARSEYSDIQVENRVYLDFIHKEMFGTYDGAVLDYFGTLHVFDYKYGAGHLVTPKKNLQMIFYGIGLAHAHGWNFKRVRLWIIQPRIRGYDGPQFWEIPTAELRRYVPLFEEAVERVMTQPDLFVEGGHCHWCKAKSICPEKTGKRLEQAIQIFSVKAIQNERKANGLKKESDEESREKENGKKGREKSSEEKELEAWYKKREQKEKRQAEKDIGDFY